MQIKQIVAKFYNCYDKQKTLIEEKTINNITHGEIVLNNRIESANKMPGTYYYEFKIITNNNEVKEFNKFDYFLNIAEKDTE